MVLHGFSTSPVTLLILRVLLMRESVHSLHLRESETVFENISFRVVILNKNADIHCYVIEIIRSDLENLEVIIVKFIRRTMLTHPLSRQAFN